MRNVVAFSLWGTTDVYLQGALDAIAQVHCHYPGWEPRFYLGADVPQATRQALSDLGAAVFDGPQWGSWAGMFWRFLAASDPDVGVMISRDVDTRILPREVAAVNEWLDSGRNFHIMRDHPKHEMPIMGGMWGCRTAALREMEAMILGWRKFDKYGCDQEFLAKVVYPVMRHHAWIHSECVMFRDEAIHPYTIPRADNEFIGISYTADDERLALQIRYLREWIADGKPVYLRPLPWSFMGLMRIYSRGWWPKSKPLIPQMSEKPGDSV
jgi:hypothetical protein